MLPPQLPFRPAPPLSSAQQPAGAGSGATSGCHPFEPPAPCTPSPLARPPASHPPTHRTRRLLLPAAFARLAAARGPGQQGAQRRQVLHTLRRRGAGTVDRQRSIFCWRWSHALTSPAFTDRMPETAWCVVGVCWRAGGGMRWLLRLSGSGGASWCVRLRLGLGVWDGTAVAPGIGKREGRWQGPGRSCRWLAALSALLAPRSPLAHACSAPLQPSTRPPPPPASPHLRSGTPRCLQRPPALLCS
jgi:hypothetical protein